MASHATTQAAVDPFTPVTSEVDWEEKGWEAESEPLTVAPRLRARIAIDLDPDDAALLGRAARLAGLTKAEFARRAALKEAADVLRPVEQ